MIKSFVGGELAERPAGHGLQGGAHLRPNQLARGNGNNPPEAICTCAIRVQASPCAKQVHLCNYLFAMDSLASATHPLKIDVMPVAGLIIGSIRITSRADDFSRAWANRRARNFQAGDRRIVRLKHRGSALTAAAWRHCRARMILISPSCGTQGLRSD